MICPFINSSCIESNCKMWLENECVIISVIGRLPKAPLHIDTDANDPNTILDECAKYLGYSRITALSRREIDDYLAHSQTVLNANERRVLMRTWRDIRRVNKERRTGNGSEWRIRQNNHGKAWSNDEDEDIKRSFSEGQTVEQIAANHKRSVISVRYRMEKYGLLERKKPNHGLESTSAPPSAGALETHP